MSQSYEDPLEIMKTLIEKLTDTFNRHPYLWMVYPILFIVPIALLISLCVRTRDKQQSPRPSQAQGRVSSRNKRQSTNNKSSDEVEDNDHQIATTNLNASPGQKKRVIKRGVKTNSEEATEIDQGGNEEGQWKFPPILDEFNLMDSDVDPARLEEIFADERLTQVIIRLPEGKGLGLAIVGGKGSTNGDLPIYIKRILPESILQDEAKLKTGDELIAVNDIILVNASRDYAIEALSNVQGLVRLLVLQEL